jgi:hypothetical protein
MVLQCLHQPYLIHSHRLPVHQQVLWLVEDVVHRPSWMRVLPQQRFWLLPVILDLHLLLLVLSLPVQGLVLVRCPFFC